MLLREREVRPPVLLGDLLAGDECRGVTIRKETWVFNTKYGGRGMTKYEVMIAVDVPHCAAVEIDADTKAEALDEVEANLEKYYCETTDWDAKWASSDCLRVVDATEIEE